MNKTLTALLTMMATGCGGVASGTAHSDGGVRTDAPARHDGALPSEAGTTDGGTSLHGSVKADAGSTPDSGISDASVACDSGTPSTQCLAVRGGDLIIGGPIAVDNDNVYWVAQGQQPTQDVVMQTSRNGAGTVSLAPGSPYYSLASDGTNVYWADNFDDPISGRVVSMPVGGGTMTTLASAVSPRCMTMDDTYVYWSDDNGIGRVAKAGGTATTLSVNGIVSPGPIAVDDANVYWSAGGLYKQSKSGGDTITLLPSATNISSLCSLALANGRLFFISGSSAIGSQIASFPVDGGVSATVLETGDTPFLLAAGVSALYWVGFGPNLEVVQSPFDGGTPLPLAMPMSHSVGDLAVASDGTLYWTTLNQVQSLTP